MSLRRRELALVALLLAGPSASSSALAGSSGGAMVRLEAKDGSVRVGDTVTVTVRITRAEAVGSVPFTIRYDSSVLELLGALAAEGGFLRQGGAATRFIVSEGSASRGGGAVVGLSRLGGGRGARGRGTLCRLAFRARQPGISALSFARAAVLDPAARPLPATFRGTSIVVRGGS